MNEGWKCPGCYLIHAPFVKSCSCQHTLNALQGVSTIKTNAQEANLQTQNYKERPSYLPEGQENC
jgi:hypothetical protein